MTRIGIYGGTFDPLHAGHLRVAHEVLAKLALDKVIFVPANIPAFKDDSAVSPANERFDSLAKALQSFPEFEVSSVDIIRGGATYTIDTVNDIRAQYPDAELYFIAGADVLTSLAHWKNIDQLLSIVNFVITSRPGYPLTAPEGFEGRITLLEIDALNTSSSALRNAKK